MNENSCNCTNNDFVLVQPSCLHQPHLLRLPRVRVLVECLLKQSGNEKAPISDFKLLVCAYRNCSWLNEVRARRPSKIAGLGLPCCCCWFSSSEPAEKGMTTLEFVSQGFVGNTEKKAFVANNPKPRCSNSSKFFIWNCPFLANGPLA